MEFVEPEDEPQPYRQPPSPDDRLWRHPSEIGPRRPSARRQLWVVGMVSAVAASLLSTGLAVVAGSLLDGGSGGGRTVDKRSGRACRQGVGGDAHPVVPSVRGVEAHRGILPGGRSPPVGGAT